MSLIDLIIPHYCCSCGTIGSILCEYCKYDTIYEKYDRCVVCLGLARPGSNLCSTCKVPFSRAWCTGERSGPLLGLINAYKFDRVRAACAILVDLIDETLPDLPRDVTVVPVPTIARHIRQRGYGHIEKIARRVATRRGYRYQEVLRRKTNSVQHGASRRDREQQAAQAFEITRVTPGVYMLIDDVYTTGATLKYAAKALLEAGATEVWVVVLSRQPLEKSRKI